MGFFWGVEGVIKYGQAEFFQEYFHLHSDIGFWDRIATALNSLAQAGGRMVNIHPVAQVEPGSRFNAPEAAKIYYVAISCTGSPGISWENAFTNLQDALAAAAAPAEI